MNYIINITYNKPTLNEWMLMHSWINKIFVQNKELPNIYNINRYKELFFHKL